MYPTTKAITPTVASKAVAKSSESFCPSKSYGSVRISRTALKRLAKQNY